MEVTVTLFHMFRSIARFRLVFFILITFILSNCSPSGMAVTSSPTVTVNQTTDSAISKSITEAPAATQYVQIINPLTGLEVQDPSLLQIPATLLSISHFPPTARPQAGLSFAPYVFEIYITEGATRFLTTFYGQFPAPEVPITGNCQVRTEIFTQTNLLIGNQVWDDENKNGIHDAWENGIGGVCVKSV